MLTFLIRHRIRPALFSHEWFRWWAKRLWNAPSLIALLFRCYQLRIKGASIGDVVVLGSIEVNGPAKRLRIGSRSAIGRIHVALHESITIGNDVIISDGCILLTGSHDVMDPDFSHIKKPIVIGDHAWIGTGAIILPGVTIGCGAVVGAGSVVTKSVPSYSVVAGNPAKIIREGRIKDLRYTPALWSAPIEAWTGKKL